MARDQAFREAERKIEEARRTGATELSLSGMRLTELPKSLGELRRLRKLQFHDNRLTDIPKSLGKLEELQELQAHHNQLTAIPVSLGQLRQLRTLDLSGNQLTALPESLGQIRQLQSLDLHNNQLTALPEWVGQLTKLQTLNLDGNHLTAISSCLGRLTQLRTLSLSRNQLAALPESLGKLTQLKRLDLDDNLLTSLPNSLSALRELEWIAFGYSDTGTSGNPIKKLPECLRCLSKLQVLGLDLCPLQNLPPWIGELSNLTTLWADNTKLSDLPPSLCKLAKLEKLTLTGVALPPELAGAYQQGLEAVKAYLRAKAEDQIVLNEAKLILIGEGEVGKSCLLDALRGDPWQEHDSTHGIRLAQVRIPMPKTNRVAGVEERGTSDEPPAGSASSDDSTSSQTGGSLRSTPATQDESAVITLNGWDFGGQRVYRPTHQLFFSSPAVYLVVWKPREGLKAGQVAEWIKLIKHREPDARILVVSTHGDDRQPDIDQYQLISEFGPDTVLGFHKVDSRPSNFAPDDESTWTGPRTGIDELRAAIANVAADLPEMGRTVPAKWQRVRERLEQSDRSWMHWDEFVAFCTGSDSRGAGSTDVGRIGNPSTRQEEGRIDNPSYCLEADQVELFARLSHTLGQLIHYHYDTALKDIVILKPDWLATAISYVLDDAETRGRHGLVSFERLSQLWNNPQKDERYPEELHPAFRRLMERFDLSYPVVDPNRSQESDTCLITQLVAEARPAEFPGWDSRPDAGDYEQQQVCRILERQKTDSATAEGLFFQLIARLSNYSLGKADHRQSVHWKYGLMLMDEYGSRALLEYVGNDVRITVRAPYPGRFLGILTEHVHSLVESFWEGLRCEITVPCLETCRRENNPAGLLAVRILIDSKRKGRTEQPCPVCNAWQDIDRLLSNSPVSPAADAIAASPFDDIMAELLAIREELGEGRRAVEDGFEQLDRRELNRFRALNNLQRRRITQVDEQFGTLLKTLTDEAKDGPRLFSFQPVETGFFDRPEWVSETFRLTLWCEHSRRPLTHRDLNGPKDRSGVYEVTLPREWFSRAAPWLRRLGNTLSMVLPILSPAVKVLTDDAAFKSFGDELALGVKCAETFLKASSQAGDWLGQNDSPDLGYGDAIRAHGGVLRELHAFLKEQDPTFGGLVRVQNKSGDFFWVHKLFVDEY